MPAQGGGNIQGRPRAVVAGDFGGAVRQERIAVKPVPEIVFGPDYEVIPVLVLTGARETFEFVPIGKTDAVLPVCSGDMLFNVFDEYLGFLQ